MPVEIPRSVLAASAANRKNNFFLFYFHPPTHPTASPTSQAYSTQFQEMTELQNSKSSPRKSATLEIQSACHVLVSDSAWKILKVFFPGDLLATKSPSSLLLVPASMDESLHLVWRQKKNMRRSLFEAELSNRSPPEILPELFHVYEVVHARKVPEYGAITLFTLPKKNCKRSK